MTKADSKSKEVTVYLPGEQGELEPLALLLPPSPDFANTSLHLAILQQFRYWGIRRTLDTYRRAVESNIEVLGAISEFYKAHEGLLREKTRWENRHILREIEEDRLYTELLEGKKQRISALTELNKLQVKLALSEDKLSQIDEIAERKRIERETQKIGAATAREMKYVELVEAKRQRELADDRLKGVNDEKKTAKINRGVGHAEAAVRKEQADKKLADILSGEGGASFGDKYKMMNQAKRDYETLQIAKAKDIRKYGGEDKIPDFLRALYDQMEDSLADRGD